MKFLLCVINLDETGLNDSFSALPERLATVISSIKGLEVDEVFLVDEKKKSRVVDVVDQAALHFHQYAVEVRHDPCTDVLCTTHIDERKVIRIHDRFPSGQKPKGNSQPN